MSTQQTSLRLPSFKGLQALIAGALLTILAHGGAALGQEIDTELRLALQRNYSNWKRAMISKDLRGWNAHTSRYRQVMTRNLIVSQKRNWPKSLFAVPISPPETENLRIVEAKSEGNVARLVYYGAVDFRVSSDAPPNNLLMLYFLKDQGAWKFDRSRYFNVLGDERIAGMARNANFSFLKEKEFAMPVSEPKTPGLCPPPYYIGYIWIKSIGYNTTAQFNNFHRTEVDDNVSREVLIGGIREGPNKLTLKVNATEKADRKDVGVRNLEVAVYVNSADKKRPRIRVFHLNPGSSPQSEYDLTVWANAITMQDRSKQ